MSTSFRFQGIRHKTILLLGYAAYFICGVSIAIYEFKVLTRVGDEDLVGPYFVTLFLVGIVGSLGVILTVIQRDAFLVILAALTAGLMLYWHLAEGSTFLEIYALIYSLITLTAPFISLCFSRCRTKKSGET